MFGRKILAVACVLASILWSFGPAAAHQERKGTVSGYVYDVKTGDVVRQVNVEVVGGDVTAQTGVDGDYLVELAPGTYSLRFFKDGYLDYTVESVVVEAGALVDQGAAITPVGFGEEITVTAGGADTLGGLIDDRKYGATLQDNIGRKEISQDPASSAAGVVQRVVGITVNNDDTVSVRGLGDRYSKTVMNDAIFPTTEPDRQAVPLNLIPSNLLQNIKVFKTFTPDQPGEFSGGLVRLETVDLPSKRSLDVSYSIGFNTETQGEDFLGYPGGSRDWLGLGARARALPGGIPDDQRVFRGNPFLPGGFTPEQLETLGESFRNVWSPEARSARPNNSFNISYGDRFGKLGFVAAVGYKNELQSLDEIRRFYSIGQNDSIDLFNDYDYTSSREYVRIGSTLNATYELTSNDRIYWKNFLTNQATDEARLFEGFNNDRATDIRNFRLRYQQERIITSQPSGSHILPWLGNTLLTWRFTYSRATLDEPDLRESLYEFSENVDEFIYFNQTQSLFRLFNDMRENIREPAFDLFKTWTLGSVTLNGKAGFSFINRDRVFDSRRFRFRPRSTFGVDTSLSPEQLLSPELIDPDRGFELGEETRPTDHYDAFHDIYSVYAMADVAWSRWRFVGGVRAEDSDQAVNTFDPFRAGAEPLQARLQNRDYLPSFQVAYSLVPDKMVLRGGYSRTIARPQFRELSPFEFTDVTGGFSVVGNSDLVRTRLENYDARFEWYIDPGEIFAASYFYKDLENPIEPVIEPTSQLRKSFRNALGAKNKGFELELRKNLGFLGSFLSPFSLNLNYTYVDSNVDIGPQDLSVLTTLERPLVGQAENVFNAVLYHDLTRWDLETRIYFNYVGDRIVDVGAQGLPDIVEQGYPSLDLAVTKRFGQADRKPWKVEVQFENLINQRRKFLQGGQPFQIYTPGREIAVEVGYSFF
jgi:hypothetical protein